MKEFEEWKNENINRLSFNYYENNEDDFFDWARDGCREVDCPDSVDDWLTDNSEFEAYCVEVYTEYENMELNKNGI